MKNKKKVVRVNLTNAYIINANPKLIIDEDEEEILEGDINSVQTNQNVINNLTSKINTNAKNVEKDENLIKETSLASAKQILTLLKQQPPPLQPSDTARILKLTTSNSIKFTRDAKKHLKTVATAVTITKTLVSHTLLSSSNYVFKVKIRMQDKTLSTESINVKCEKMNASNGKLF